MWRYEARRVTTSTRAATGQDDSQVTEPSGLPAPPQASQIGVAYRVEIDAVWGDLLGDQPLRHNPPHRAGHGDRFRGRIEVAADIALPLCGANLRCNTIDPFLIEARNHLRDRWPAQARIHDFMESTQLFWPAATVIEIEGNGGEQRMNAVNATQVPLAQTLAVILNRVLGNGPQQRLPALEIMCG